TGRLLEACTCWHGCQLIRRRQRQFGEPAARREQDRVHPFARLDTGPLAHRFDDTGDFLPWDERQGDPWEAAAEEANVPQTDTRAMDPDQRLSRSGLWIWQFTQFHAVDPIQLPCQRYSHGSELLTVPCCSQLGSQHGELAAWQRRVEAVLDQPAGRSQASQRPPRADHVEIDVGAVAGDEVAKVLLVSERQAGGFRPVLARGSHQRVVTFARSAVSSCRTSKTSREDTMTMLRVSKAEIPSELRERMIKQFGAV